MQSKIALQAVILDLAGTCVDYGSRAPVEAFVELFRRRGVAVDFERARAPMGLGKRDHIAAMLAHPETAARWREVHGRDPDPGEIETLYREFEPLQLELLPRSSRPIPGLRAAVERLRAAGRRGRLPAELTPEAVAELARAFAEELAAEIGRKHGFRFGEEFNHLGARPLVPEHVREKARPR